MAHAEKNKEVQLVKKENTSLTLPVDIDFASDADEFGANYSQEQMTTPFLNILNALSPQVSRGKPEFMKDAQVGQLFNTVTKDVYDGEKGINLILSSFKESFIEWVPRNEGGGFVGEFDVTTGLKAVTEIDVNFNSVIQPGSPVGTPGHWLTLTHTRLGAIVAEDFQTWSPVVLSLSNSGIKVSKNLNSRHKLMEWKNPATGKAGDLGKCPMPLILWKLKTKLATNKNGDSWFTWDFDKQGQLNELMTEEQFLHLYRSIRDFSTSSKGKQVMEDASRNADVVQQAKDITGSAKDLNDDIPF